MDSGWDVAIAYLAVFIAGDLVGWGELLGRYRDNPLAMWGHWAARIYVTINGLGSVLALLLIRSLPIDGFANDHLLQQALLAGFGSMAFFRTSLFTARVGNADIAIGPAHLLQQVLASVDSYLDRNNARMRIDDSARIMAGVDFDVAKSDLPVVCFGAMEDLSDDERKAIDDAITRLDQDKTARAEAKTITLGQILHEAVGREVLSAAVEALKLKAASPPAPAPATPGIAAPQPA
jgi:hypothetical protein